LYININNVYKLFNVIYKKYIYLFQLVIIEYQICIWKNMLEIKLQVNNKLTDKCSRARVRTRVCERERERESRGLNKKLQTIFVII